MVHWKRSIAMFVLLPVLLVAGVRAASIPQPDDRLPEAAKRGDLGAVEVLLRSGVPVDSAEGDGSTALHWAAYEDNLALAQVLLDAHANVKAATRVGALTPLLMACQNGSAKMIELLLGHGAEANGANALGTTPLMLASASGSVAAVKVLLAHGADANVREHARNQTALMFAANLDRGDVVRALIAGGADPGLASNVVNAPKLSRAANQAVVAAAGIKGAKVKEASDDNSSGGKEASGERVHPTAKPEDAKVSVAGVAASAADDDAAKKVLRDHGAKMMGGMTPLLYAARQGSLSAALALLDGGAKIDQVSGSEHTTPLVLAISNGHLDLAKMLVEHGANVNLANDMGVTALFATIDVKWVPHEWSPEPIVDQEKTNYLVLMKLLIDHGANLNARLGKQPWSRTMSENRNWSDPAGATAFFRAAQADDIKAMRLLKEAGADTNITSTIGTTPLMVAAGLGWAANYSTTAPTRLEAIEYCMSLGADVNAHDDLGYTALHGAAFVGDLGNIHYLVDHGAKVDAKTKAGDTVADAANGLFEKSLPNPDAVALLEKLGSLNSHNCRSSDCVPPVKEDKKPTVVAAAADAKKVAE